MLRDTSVHSVEHVRLYLDVAEYIDVEALRDWILSAPSSTENVYFNRPNFEQGDDTSTAYQRGSSSESEQQDEGYVSLRINYIAEVKKELPEIKQEPGFLQCNDRG